jgi:hypothetical protein
LSKIKRAKAVGTKTVKAGACYHTNYTSVVGEDGNLYKRCNDCGTWRAH